MTEQEIADAISNVQDEISVLQRDLKELKEERVKVVAKNCGIVLNETVVQYEEPYVWNDHPRTVRILVEYVARSRPTDLPRMTGKVVKKDGTVGMVTKRPWGNENPKVVGRIENGIFVEADNA